MSQEEPHSKISLSLVSYLDQYQQVCWNLLPIYSLIDLQNFI